MEARLIAGLILLPFVAAFVYAGIHEYLRFKSEGPSDYGLVYNEDSGTTHVSALADSEDGFDPEDYDPKDFNDPEVNNALDEGSNDTGEEDSART
jgi:hypothetical protein